MRTIYGTRITNTVYYVLGIVCLLSIIAGWNILKKAGEKPWKILIPFYGSYCLYKVANSEGVFWGTFVVSMMGSILSTIVSSGNRGGASSVAPVIAIIEGIIILLMEIYYLRQLAGAFGKGAGFTVGLVLLFPIFALILGCGSAEYSGYAGLDRFASATGTWKCSECGTENRQSRGTCPKCGRPREVRQKYDPVGRFQAIQQ